MTFIDTNYRDKNYDILLNKKKEQITNKKGTKSMKSIKDYFLKHQESIISLGLLLLLDEYIFEGKFRERIKNIVENLFTKTEKNLLGKDNE